MARSDTRLQTEKLVPQATDSPAVAIDGRETSSHDVAGAILRATAAGHHTLVFVTDRTSETAEFADRLGATLVEDSSDRTRQMDVSTPARQLGFPGIIFQTDPTNRVDYSSSLDQLYESPAYIIDAHPAPVIESRPDTLVGIPAYNEGDTIGEVVSGAKSIADSVLVVNDGSEDNTDINARSAGATVINHDTNMGYGAALKTIFSEAARCEAQKLVIIDGDGQHDPADISNVIDGLKMSEADIVIASRFAEGPAKEIPRYRRVGLTVINFLTNMTMGTFSRKSRITDTQSGFRAYSYDAIQTLAESDLIDDGMSASTDILYHIDVKGFEIEEVPISVSYDVRNPNSEGPLAHGIHLVKHLFELNEFDRPLITIGIPSAMLLFLSIGVSYLSIVTMSTSGPLLMLGILSSVLIGVVGFFGGITAAMLHALKRYHQFSG